MEIRAVLTGDISNFTKLSPKNRKLLMEDSEKLLKSWIKQSTDAEIFRGDSYQILFDDISEALKRSIQLICWFKTRSDQKEKIYLSTRISVGIGKVAYRGKNILTSDGEAFHLSGRNFDKLRNWELLSVHTNNEEKNDTIEIILNFVNKTINQWTIAQAEVIFELLEEKTQQEIANKLTLSQPSVNSRIKLANWKDIELALEFIAKLAKKR